MELDRLDQSKYYRELEKILQRIEGEVSEIKYYNKELLNLAKSIEKFHKEYQKKIDQFTNTIEQLIRSMDKKLGKKFHNDLARYYTEPKELVTYDGITWWYRK